MITASRWQKSGCGKSIAPAVKRIFLVLIRKPCQAKEASTASEPNWRTAFREREHPRMRPPRFMIARLMVAVALVAIVLAVFRACAQPPAAGARDVRDCGLDGPIGINSVRAWRVLLVAPVGTLLLPFLAAIWFNHERWGYYFSRPPLDQRIVEARQIETITAVRPETDAQGDYLISGTASPVVDGHIEVPARGGDYDVREGRVLSALRDRPVQPAGGRKIAAEQLRTLYNALDDTGSPFCGLPRRFIRTLQRGRQQSQR